MKLAPTKVDKLLDSIATLNSSIESVSLAKRTVKATSNLIQNLNISFDVFNPDNEPIAEYNWHEPHGFITEHLFEAFTRYWSEHIFFEQISGFKSGVYRNTDAISLTDFMNNNLYHEAFKKVDITHQLHTTMPINKELAMVCTLTRNNFDFSNEEKMMLKILSPHIRLAIDNANALEKVIREKSKIENVLSNFKSAIMIFDESGKVIQKTKSCHRLIAKYFEKDTIDNNGLPETLKVWMKSYQFHPKEEGALEPIRPILVNKGDEHLRIRLIIENRKRQKTLLFDEKSEVTLEQISTLGLTNRESEVLFWISKGKTNPEIAILLDISPRTVQKHTENLYTKLGVETRTAAALRINQLG